MIAARGGRMADEKRIRLWPVVVILGLDAAFMLWNWLRDDVPFRQFQVLWTALASLLTFVALLAWWTFFSRVRRGWRLIGLAAVIVLGVAAGSFVEYRGLSGDLVPQLAWRDSGSQPPPPLPLSRTAEAKTAAESGADPFREPAREVDSPVTPAVDLSGQPPNPEAAIPAEPPGSFPQFLGPDRNATLSGIELARDWRASPPQPLWRQPIGEGWSGFAVEAGLAITQEQRQGREAVVAYSLKTGEVLWNHQAESHFESPLAGNGPRATPTIHDGIVYAYGVRGTLWALELESGALLFSKHVLEDSGASVPPHGVAASPLIVDNMVVVLAGGDAGQSLVAYDAGDGTQRWTAGDDPAAYSSPMIATLGGVRQIVVFNQAHVTGHDIASGAVLWAHPWPRGSERVAQPLLLDGDRLLVSTGYGIGGELLQVERGEDGKFSIQRLWESRRLKAKFTQLVEHNGSVYGLDDGVLVCLDPGTGERRWKRGRYGHGQLLLVDDLLLLQTEDGGVVLIDPNPERLIELSRFQAVEGTVWATPTLAGDILLIRGDTEVACYRLPTRESGKTALEPATS
jgi:outer membrane protein assembly factor BamB